MENTNFNNLLKIFLILLITICLIINIVNLNNNKVSENFVYYSKEWCKKSSTTHNWSRFAKLPWSNKKMMRDNYMLCCRKGKVRGCSRSDIR